jgi:coatomer subunit beta'
VQLWKEDLQKQNPKAAESLADPAEYPNLFPELQRALLAAHEEEQAEEESPAAMDEVSTAAAAGYGADAVCPA